MIKSAPRIVFFTSLPEVGGHTTTTLGLCQLFRRHGHEVEILCKTMPEHGLSQSVVAELTELGCRVTMLNGIKGGLDKFAVVRVALRYLFRPAEVFLTMGMRDLSPVLARVIRNKRSLYYHITHNLTEETARRLNAFSRVFDKILFVSPATFHNFKNVCRDLPKIDWALQESSLGLELPDRKPSPAGMVRFGLIGRLTKSKGSAEILQFIDTSDVPCEVHVAGVGEYAIEFEDRAQRPHGGSKVRVVYHGSFSAGERREFLRRFFAGVDWLCIPTVDEWESISMAALEALQHGVSVLTNRTGGLKSFDMAELGPPPAEVIWRVDPQDFRATMTRIAAGDIAAPASPGQCLEYYKKYFSSDAVASKWLELLSS
jgi:glycosyltransferase involved in cell wall biosynthesis